MKSSVRNLLLEFRRTLILLAITLFTVLPSALFIHVWSSLPEMSELREIRHHQSSRVLSADGKLLGLYYLQNRTHVDLDEVSPHFIDALIAVEDIRFYEHTGIDWRSMLRVLVKSILLQQDAGGGSTLTQQLAKNLYPRQGGTLFHLAGDKLKEILIAGRIERLYSKPEILELYLNTVSFGEETFGVEAASLRFFSKPSAELQIHEAALLAGLLKAPGMYHPARYPDRSITRRNIVLRQMEKYGKLAADEADRLIQHDADLDYRRISSDEGLAPYFREHLRLELRQLLREQPALDGKHYNLYTDGLIIETTLDSRLQSAAEQAVRHHLNTLQTRFNEQRPDTVLFLPQDPAIVRAWKQSPHYDQLVSKGASPEEIKQVFHTPQPMTVFTHNGLEERVISPYDSLRHYLSFLNAGFLALTPQTGEILAWVGGIHHKYFKYDHVKSKRQTGSAFKPVVYSAALETGIRPCDYHRNLLNQYEAYDEWTPRNIRQEYGGYYSTQAALANSVNTISVDILMQTGVGRIQQHASSLGITSTIPAEPSIALGTAELSLLEMIRAYAVFANGGQRITPHYITGIYDSEGRLLYRFENPNLRDRSQVLQPETAASMISMLSKAVDEGTGQALRSQYGITHALAGKTGTTQQNTDGWFIGFSPNLVFGSWVGGSDSRIRFRESTGFASRTALPIAGEFLKNLQQEPSLEPMADHFPSELTDLALETQCPDYRDDSALDRFRDFITGKDHDEPRRIQPEREKKNLVDRFLGLFGKK